jgi:hypothetical protein
VSIREGRAFLHLLLAATGVLSVTGCAYHWVHWNTTEPYARVHPDYAYLAWASLQQGCPVVGLSAAATKQVFGRAIVDTPATGRTRWRYRRGSHGVLLELEVAGDTVTDWRIDGTPDRSIARVHYFWSGLQARGFPQRVDAYLLAHPQTSANVAFILYRACPQIGLTSAEFAASWGPPTRVDTLVSRALVRWTYGFGVEGQHEDVFFRDSRLVLYRAAGWPREVTDSLGAGA